MYTADVRSALNSFRKWDGSIADRIDPKIQQTLSHEDIVAIGREVLQKLFGAKANGAMRAAADKNFPKYPKLSGMSTSDVIAAEARYEDQVRDFLVGQKLKDIPLGAAKTAGLFLQQPEIPGAKDAFGHAALYCYYGIDEAGIGKPESGKK